MRLIVGIVILFAAVIGGYVAEGGNLMVLMQPFEALIILGAALGAFIIGNTGPVIKQTLKIFGVLMRGPRYNKAAYIELLGLQYSIYKLIQSKGVLALEAHVEDPANSSIFQAFPTVANNHHAVVFLCDYLRMITLGTRDVHQMDALIDEELETHHQESERIILAVQALADGTPALGIVAAVLGVIHTMGSISQPPEILGEMIGGALVGTFLGVFCAYGFFGPMAQALRNIYEAEGKYLMSVKAGLLAHMSGQPPAMCIEVARKALMSEVRPTFTEVEESTAGLPALT
jgi:chemotaxis protein MotA